MHHHKLLIAALMIYLFGLIKLYADTVYSVDKDGKESLIIKDAIVCRVSDEITMDGKYRSVTAASGLLKGRVFGLLVWFLRVAMQVASQWMMLNIPASTLLYMLIGGLVEMLVLGLLCGLTLRHSI